MASISCTQFKSTGSTSGNHGRWNGWYSGGSSAGLVMNSNYGYLGTMLIRGDVDYTGADSIYGAAITLTIKRNSAQAMVNYGNIECYVYTSEPSAPSTSVPSGYVTSTSAYIPRLDAYGETTVTFTLYFNNTYAQSLYFLLVNERTEGLVAYLPSSSSGYFNLPSVTMSLSSSSVTTGGNQVVTFANGSGRSVSVAVKYNNTTLWSGSTTNGSLTIPVQKSWFSSAGITTYREFSVSIQATESYSGTIYDSFYIVAGSDMNPTVGTPTVSIVQASGKPTTYYPSTYLANISKAKIAVSVSSGSNASIASVVLTYTGGSSINMSYNSSTGKYEATTPELVSASTSFTVTAKDGRRYNRSGTDVGGMSTAKTSSAISVVQYTPPSVNIDAGATFRCTQSGSQASGGAYYMAKAASSYYSSLSGNTLLSFFVRIHGSQTTHNLTSGVQAGPLDGTLAARTSYTLEFVIEDKVSPAVIKSFPLGSQIRDVVAIHNSTGTALGVGTTPETAAGSSVEMAMGGKFMVGGFLWGSITRLHDTATDGSQFGQDFLGVDTGVLYDDGNAEAYFIMSSTSGWTHYPVSSTPFKGIRKVLWINSTNILVVILEAAPTAGRIWINYYDGSAWSGWKNHAPA